MSYQFKFASVWSNSDGSFQYNQKMIARLCDTHLASAIIVISIYFRDKRAARVPSVSYEMRFGIQEEPGSPVGSDKVAEEEGEDLDDEYDEEEEDDDERPRKKPRHGGFILDEAGLKSVSSGCLRVVLPSSFLPSVTSQLFFLFADVDDEYEDEEDQWEEGAEDILEKGEDVPRANAKRTLKKTPESWSGSGPFGTPR